MLKINSDFEAGAISVIQAVNANDIQLAINKDNQSCTRQWFYFSVDTGTATSQRIRLLNAADVSFSGAFDGYQAFASYDTQHWFRVDTEFSQGELILHHHASSSRVYYAYFVPYTSARQQALEQTLRQHPAATLSVLGQTPQGRNLTLLQLGSNSLQARKIWLIARQHPGETMAQWIAGGVIKQLAAYFSQASIVTAPLRFYIVANMNPDGAALGNHRTNANGLNLNRHWSSPDPILCPEVFLVKHAMLHAGVDAFIDIHGDETLPYNFMMAEQPAPFAEQLKQILAANNANFQTQYDYSTTESGCATSTCSSRCGQQKATSFVHQQFGAPSILLEAAFKPLHNLNHIQPWDHLAAIALGQSLAKAILTTPAVLPEKMTSELLS